MARLARFVLQALRAFANAQVKEVKSRGVESSSSFWFPTCSRIPRGPPVNSSLPRLQIAGCLRAAAISTLPTEEICIEFPDWRIMEVLERSGFPVLPPSCARHHEKAQVLLYIHDLRADSKAHCYERLRGCHPPIEIHVPVSPAPRMRVCNGPLVKEDWSFMSAPRSTQVFGLSTKWR